MSALDIAMSPVDIAISPVDIAMSNTIIGMFMFDYRFTIRQARNDLREFIQNNSNKLTTRSAIMYAFDSAQTVLEVSDAIKFASQQVLNDDDIIIQAYFMNMVNTTKQKLLVTDAVWDNTVARQYEDKKHECLVALKHSVMSAVKSGCTEKDIMSAVNDCVIISKDISVPT